jgi:hypothetical protein
LECGGCGRKECGFRGDGDGLGGWRGGDVAYGSDEAVAAAGEGFDEARIVSRVSEGFADLVDGGAEGVVEVDDGVFAPEALLEFFAGDDLSGAFEEGGEDFEGLGLELDAEAGFPDFAGLEIDLVEAEGEPGIGGRIAGGADHVLPRTSRFRL